MQTEGATYYAISKELNAKESRELAGKSAFVLSSGDLKVMDLIYCPFGKTCKNCDKRRLYTLTDEQNRVFPVRRYLGGDGNCRFEVYNCATLIGTGIEGIGKLLDVSVFVKKEAFVAAVSDTDEQKRLCDSAYTSGHASRGVL
jgi:hypothetical protein